MVQLFSFWPSVPNHNVRTMFPLISRLTCVLLLASCVLYGQAQPAPEKIKKSVASMQNAVNDIIGVTVPGWGVLQAAKGAYLDGYGVVVNVEVAFETPLNPFNGQKSPDEVRSAAAQKRKEILEKLTNLLKQKVPSLEDVGAAESVTIVLNVLNTNPAYTPDMPTQIILTARKQDATRVNVRDYK
jgi:hypothetical protein